MRHNTRSIPWLSILLVAACPAVVGSAWWSVRENSRAVTWAHSVWQHKVLGKPKTPPQFWFICGNDPASLPKNQPGARNHTAWVAACRDDPSAKISWVSIPSPSDAPANAADVYEVTVTGLPDKEPFWAPANMNLHPSFESIRNPDGPWIIKFEDTDFEQIAACTPGFSRAERSAISKGVWNTPTPNWTGLSVNAATVGALLAFPIVSVRTSRWGRRRFRSDQSRCPSCGYSLTGLPQSDSPTCPECGFQVPMICPNDASSQAVL